METPYTAAQDVEILPSHFPIPGLGVVPVNAFVIKAKEPVLVDTGLVQERDDFMECLHSVINPEDLRWVWITHTDQDHIGSLHRLLQESPQVRVITTFLGVGKMSLFAPLPMDRVFLLNPGQSIDVGDRKLTAVRPPSFDAPETTGLFDDKSKVFFSSDCFGALLSSPTQDLSDITQKELADAQTLWATLDAPLAPQGGPRNLWKETLNGIREMSPDVVLNNHLPPASGMVDQLLNTLTGAPGASPFTGPDQAALEAMLAEMTGVN